MNLDGNRADSFLRLIRRSQRGRLKIYLGYAPGVGKTYQMLLEARHLKDDGIDMVVGLVETHGRQETEALLDGLEVIPRRRIVYRGIEIEEMDFDAILARRPSVVIVDELAHTNVPGSRNAKRYQDVEEILAAGIHLVSTLNVQHMESLYETVQRATGVRVRERVPDRIVAEADQLVNVDLTTEDLRRRLREGKVYTRERIEVALDHFFRTANLGQLRELTLRELAAQIDWRRRDEAAEETHSSPDQVMVCLSSRGPNSEALLRYASRLAGRLNRRWYAVYVQTTSEQPTAIDTETQRMLSNNLALAQQLGATVFTYRGDDVVKTILQFAKEYLVGHIVIGAPGERPTFWRRMTGKRSISERLIAEGLGITVVVVDTRIVPGDLGPSSPAPPPELAGDVLAAADEAPPKEASLLADGRAFIWHEPLEKEAAMKLLLDACCPTGAAVRDRVWAAVVEREKQGSTFVGEDVALPHARIEETAVPRVALGVGKSGIRDPETGLSARIMIMLLSPAGEPDSHVRMLGAIGRLACDDQWRREVLAAANPSEVVQITNTWGGLS